MQAAALTLFLPCCLALVGIWTWASRTGRRQLSDTLLIGFVGGLLGTMAYDIFRVPFNLAGQRVFAPISVYGIWLAEAASSTRFTEVVGWSYHFSNGISFGMMYALFMRGRYWGWAILWGLTLETIAVVSPFAKIFSLAGNYQALLIAYLGHVAYGLPLGWLVHRWDETREQLASMPAAHKWSAALLGCAALGWPLVSPERVGRDARKTDGEFRVEGARLNPDWLRVGRGGSIQVFNPQPEAVTVRVRQGDLTVPVAGGRKEQVTFNRAGIYQVFVETGRRSRSSFVIVEPVEEQQ